MIHIQELKDLRKALKLIGFNVKTKTYSHGQHAHFTNSVGNKLPTLFFTQEELAEWQPLLDYLDGHKNDLISIKHNEQIYGLIR
jgi:hypothetical protein